MHDPCAVTHCLAPFPHPIPAAEEEVALSDQMGPPSNGKKRKADEAEVDPDPFKKVVKKLLVSLLRSKAQRIDAVSYGTAE